ncbi:SLBB domain-containing protein [Desulfonema magnum]|uniref:Polysaccharide export protein n=1 Tax=Desulfonema magnum TaxID=45655 RepID=A0A975GL64_9BACT|nr:SLBB domain-containing protein [Desulfonema magnum]QTA85511.1 putative polysaccharide export protein [Desulfonema magnum]
MNYQKIVKTIFSMGFLLLTFLVFHETVMAQDSAYFIGPRDVLSVTVYAGGEEQLKVRMTVTARGMINVPFIGSLKAEGRTTSELESLITKPMATDYFVNPEVNVNILEYHSLRYYISGAVSSPGLYEMRSKTTLMRLIAKAGGVLPDRGNLAYILRDSTEQIAKGQNVEKLLSHKEPKKANLKKLLDEGDMSHDMPLQSGDVVYIPLEKAMKAESKIYVEGEVRSPGIYDYRPGLTALNACIMAGGFGRFAAPNRTRIIRKRNGRQKIIRIDLNEVKMGRIPDVELKPGDMINVPETWL